MSELYNLPLMRHVYSRLINLWSQLPDDVIHRMEEHDLADAKEHSKAVAQAEVALQRGDQLDAIAASAWPLPVKHLLTFAVGIFGAMVVGSSAMGLVASTGRGPAAAAGGAIAGGASAVLTDIYATRYLMRRRMRYNTQQALAQIRAELAQLPNPTEIQIYQYLCQEQLLQQVESQYWAKEPKSEELMAISAISAEGIIALIVAFPAGLSLALASAAIPIVINLLIAKVQSDRFEIPEACEQLLPLYDEHVPPETILALEALQVVRLNAGLQYVSTTRPPREVRSVDQAKGLAQVKFSRERMADLEEQGLEKITAREQAFQAALEALPERCPEPDVRVQGLTEEEAKALKDTWRLDWIQVETQKLQEQLQADLKLLQGQYGQAIAFWQQREVEGIQEYRTHEPEGDHPEAA